jgi:hypothetical protein
VLALPVRNGHRVTDVRPRGDGLVELAVEAEGRTATRAWARRVVVATGRAGLGGPALPVFARRCRERAGRTRPTTTTTPRSPGCASASIGAGASAMDSAATALEAGAAHVHLLVRRADLPRINKGKGAGNPGFVAGYARLSDDWKWRIRHYINTQQVPPPRNSTQRVSRHANAHFHLGVSIVGVEERDGALHVRTSAGPIELDFLIFATGFKVDWRQRPMLRHIAPCIRVWKDRYDRPPPATRMPSSRNRPTSARRSSSRRAQTRLPGPRSRALPQLPGDALARRHHRRHPGDQRRRAAARRQARRAALWRGHRAPLRAHRGLRRARDLGDEVGRRTAARPGLLTRSN